jgi:hypothetical protein
MLFCITLFANLNFFRVKINLVFELEFFKFWFHFAWIFVGIEAETWFLDSRPDVLENRWIVWWAALLDINHFDIGQERLAPIIHNYFCFVLKVFLFGRIWSLC